MPRLHLTDMAVRRIKSAGQQTIYWDTVSPVALRVSQAGGKSFLVVVGDERQKITLGKYPELSLADAREKAQKVIRDHGKAPPPSQHVAVAEALERYLSWSQLHNRSTTLYEKRRVIERHLASLRPKLLHEVTSRDAGRILDALSNTPSEARHAYIVMRAFFGWCVSRQFIERSPCETLPPPARSHARERVLDDRELAVVYAAAGTFESFGRIVRLCIATGQRRGEIAALRWSYIDAERDLILLPGSAVKNGRAHTVPFTSFAQAHLPTKGVSPFVFPARGNDDRPYNGWSKSVDKLKSMVGFDDWCLHDLRRSAASGMARLGVQPHVIERILNHAPQGMTAVYQRHHYMDEMRSALELWSVHVERLARS